MKIIETLDEAARAIPPEERYWAKEQRYQKELQERMSEQEALHSLINSPTPKVSEYIEALEDLESLVVADPNYQGEYSKELTFEALRFSVDVINWVFNLTYHLDQLNKFHKTLHEEETHE